MISVGYDFNPRSREGSDDSVQFTDDRLGVISIRAPARGATDIAGLYAHGIAFQSALPRGERRFISVHP